jgi:hypothetical protein
MLTTEERKQIATEVIDEMENRRRRRMEEMPPPPPPRKERRLCLVTVTDHGVGFPGQDSRVVLEKCFYAWGTFRTESFSPGPTDVVIVAMGDGRKLSAPLKTTLLAGIISCVEVADQGLFGTDPQEDDK